MDYLIVGAGLSGCTLARVLAEKNKKVKIIDTRPHVGGNCYDFINEHGIRVCKYGAHIFHTNNERVWKFVNKYSSWTRYDHYVKAKVDDKSVVVPVNINTVNALCDTHIDSGEAMTVWLNENTEKREIVTSEDVGLSRFGSYIYEKMFKTYTYKQWGKYPEELDPTVLGRISCRPNFDNRYFTDKWQALPTDGYTAFFNRLLDHENITINLSTNYFDIPKPDCVVLFTGPIDAYFTGYPKLEYRSVVFTTQHIKTDGFFQETSVINYPSDDVNYTRIVEYKHFLNQKSDHTTVVYETTTDDSDNPYYPVPSQRNKDLYRMYQGLAEKTKDVYFIGRLANYKYFNMDEAVLNALEFIDAGHIF